MKKKLAFILTLLFYASILPWVGNAEYYNYNAKSVTGDGTGNISGFDNLTVNGRTTTGDLITGGPWVDVRAYDTALTDVPIRAAIDNTTAGDIFVPAGVYDVTYAIGLLDKSNVHLRGAGIGKTIFRASSLLSHGTLGVCNVWGIVWVDSSTATPVDNVVVDGISFEYTDNTNFSQNQKLFFYGLTDNFTAKNCSFSGGYWEMLYSHGATVGGVNYGPTNTKINNNIFSGGLSEQCTLNTPQSRNTWITNNHFSTGASSAIHAMGSGLNVLGNIVYRGKGYVINVGEGGDSVDAAIISNNILYEPGYGGTGGTIGISWSVGYNTTVAYYDNGITPRSAIISNNTVYNLVGGATASKAFSIRGPAIVNNNVVSGCSHSSDNKIGFVVTRIGGDNTDIVQKVFFNNNVIDDTNNTQKWTSGFSFGQNEAGDNNIIVRMANNYAGDVPADHYAIITSNGNTPTVYLNGDTVGAGYILLRKGVPSGTMNVYAPLLDGVPLYGNSASQPTMQKLDYGSDGSGIKVLTANSATPSVAGIGLAKTANTAPTTITNFTGGWLSQQLTLWLQDINTTITNGTNIMLDNNVNYTSKVGDMITFIYMDDSKWYEESRSVK